MSSGGGKTTTTTKADPWKGQQPYLKEVFSEAQNLYDTWNPTYFPGDTVANLTPFQMAGVGKMASDAMGNPATAGALSEFGKTMGGDYLSAGNPYFSNMADTITAKVLPAIQGQFAGGNRMGGGLAARASAQGLGDAIGSLAYQNYGDERTNMMRAMMSAPQLQAMMQGDANALLNAGGILQGQSQAEINDQIARHNFEQQLPVEKLSMLNQFIQGNYGGTSATTQPYSTNPVAGALGGAASGAAMGSMILPGWGTAGGALLGGLMGLF